MTLDDNTDSVGTDNTATEATAVENPTEAHEIPFMDTLPQAVREMPHLDGVSDLDGFINRISELGKGPDIPEKYEVNVPDSLIMDDELMGNFQIVAKDAGLTQPQAQKIADLWHATIEKSLVERRGEADKSMKALQSDWGKDYDKNVALAKKAVNHFGDKELVDYLNATGMGNHTKLIKLFKEVGKAISEDSMIGIEQKEKPREVDRWNGMPLLNFKMK